MLPELFIQQMKTLLGPEYESFVNSYEDRRHYGLRLNPLKMTPMIRQKVTELKEQVAWWPEGFYFDEAERPAKDPYYFAGAYYLQEPSAMTSVAALDPKPGELILDMCGAPGGKSTQIAGALGGRGLLVANDISTSRARTMNKNLQLLGVRHAQVMNEDPEKLAINYIRVFDRILIDAPCSGEGMFRKDPKLIDSWLVEGPSCFVGIQESLLEAGHKMLKPGGVMVYSTCTYNKEENEHQIEKFMERHPDYTLETLSEKLGIGHGLTTKVQGAGRVWPHLHKGEGHFIAKLIKPYSEAASNNQAARPCINPKIKEAVLDFFREIGYMAKEAEVDGLNENGDLIYVLPKEALSVKGLRTIAAGWLIGTTKKGRFEPSQAMAAALMAGEVKRCINLSHDDERVLRYLKGETIEYDMTPGYALVCVDGAGLGFGKVVGGRLKNKLEPSWRYM